jgi:hypothetical protein
LVIGNRFIGAIDAWAPVGNNSYASVVAGTAVPAYYMPATNSRYIGNRFGSGRLRVGEYWSNDTDDPADLPANNNLLEANTRDSEGSDGQPAHLLIASKFGVSPAQTNTTVNGTTTEPFTPAVKLTASDVGLLAPDPLCP